MTQNQSFQDIFKNKLDSDQLKQFNKIYYGRESHEEIALKESSVSTSKENEFEIAAYSFHAAEESTRKPRLVKVGLIQNSIVLPTYKPIQQQREAIFAKIETLIEVAASEGVNILCLQETWPMPFFLCTREKEKWSGFAESPIDGPSVTFLCNLSKKFDMVIISPILEDDDGVWWNTAVVIDSGKVMGKHRKNHLPSVGSFNETTYYSPGNLGHPVFETKYGRIAVNICYGRHHALNWLMFALNGAEIVFNPAATISEFGETFWSIEARNAAIANSYYTCSINRVGKELFVVRSENKDKEVERRYYGSSYVTAPNGVRTPSLSNSKDGLLIVNIDLNMCRQVKEQWGINMTARLNMYAEELQDENTKIEKFK